MSTIRGAVITVSDRCASGMAEDRSGPHAVTRLREAGYAVVSHQTVPDGIDAVQAAITAALDAGARVVVTTGGTGVGPRDLTPEATASMLDRPIPGLVEEIRRVGSQTLPTAVLSRAVAGTIGSAVVINAPGSPGGVADTLGVLIPVLEHLLTQLEGADHG